MEGGEGAGKTTVLHAVGKALDNQGYNILTTREPGGIEIAEQIRNVILDPANTKMQKRTEALLFAAARHQHLAEKVLPALEAGKIVLCDRFIDSSLAYQGYAQGLGMDEVFSVIHFAFGAGWLYLNLFFILEAKKAKRNGGLLFGGARPPPLGGKGIPGLEGGKIVVCDPFIDSRLGLQGLGQGPGMGEVFSVNQFAIRDCMPYLTLFFDIEPKKG